MESLFTEQVNGLAAAHHHLLYWTAKAMDRGATYNITNAFDDLKAAGVTRTKQSAVSFVETLHHLRLIELRDEGNRRNLYLTVHGGRALLQLSDSQQLKTAESQYLKGRAP